MAAAARARPLLEATRFASELATLIAVFAWGVGNGSAGRWLLAVVATLAVAALWGRYVAPRSPRRLADPARLVVEVVVFAVGGTAAAAVWGPVVGVVGAGIAIGVALAIRATASDA